jgi:hypothetical protein
MRFRRYSGLHRHEEELDMEDKQVSLNAIIKFIEDDIADIRYAFDEKKEWMFAADVMEDLVNAIKQQSW